MLTDIHPRSDEVLEQLNKILSSRYFSNSDVQSKLLRLTVESALNDLPVTLQDLNGVDGTNYSADSHKGRQNLLFMRRKVFEYYKTEGIEDLVIINPPFGRSNKATFSYHSDARAFRELEKGIRLRHQMTFDDLRKARDKFEELIFANKRMIQPYLEFGETALLRNLTDFAFGKSSSCNGDVIWALIHAQSALEIDPQCHRAFLIAGAAYMMRFERESADAVFAIAIDLFKEKTLTSLWYAAYLVATGDLDKALQITGARFDADVESAECSLVHAFFLYLAGEPNEASSVIRMGVPTAGIARFQNLVRGLIELELQNFESAYHFFKCASEEEYFEFRFRKGVTEFMNSLAANFDGSGPDSLAFRDTLNGFVALAASGLRRDEEVEGHLEGLLNERTAPSMQIVFVLLALGEPDAAIIAFQKARDQCDPYAMLAYVLPIFDAVRAKPKFIALLEEGFSDGRSIQDWFHIR